MRLEDIKEGDEVILTGDNHGCGSGADFKSCRTCLGRFITSDKCKVIAYHIRLGKVGVQIIGIDGQEKAHCVVIPEDLSPKRIDNWKNFFEAK